MAFSLGKLRAALVAGVVLVLIAVGAAVWYGGSLARGFHLKLPKRLGANITREMNGFTYSQSSKGRTLFTVHASTYVQQKSGLVTLHDASITLYGREDGQADTIRGQQFEFDQPRGLLRAVGVVYLDLAAPSGGAATAAPSKTAPQESRVVHVKTSGLVFNQQAQTAATDERIDWTVQGMTGDAIGADYNAKTGEVVLRSMVHVSGTRDGRPVALAAAHADMQRTVDGNVKPDMEQATSLLYLEQARYTSPGVAGAQTFAGDHALIHLTRQGSPQQIDAQGHVALAEAGRGTMTGDKLLMTLNGSGQPQTGRLWGGVRYIGAAEPGRQVHGAAGDLRVAFNPKGEPQRALLTGGVQGEETAGQTGRSLSADHVELALGEAVKGRVTLQAGEAVGNAVLRLMDAGRGNNATGKTTTEVRGDDLKAHFVPDTSGRAAGAMRVSDLNGQGHTQIIRLGADGSRESSRGDTLEATFKSAAPGGNGALDTILRATQRGSVSMVRLIPPASRKSSGLPTAKSPAAPAGSIEQHGTAETAVYEGDADRVTLTGGVQLRDASDLLLADRVMLDHGTGDATAEGNVRTTYIAADGKGEPVHVLSARAVERKQEGTAEFFGQPGPDAPDGPDGHNARMWQGLSQVEAPVLSFDRERHTLVAHGEAAGDTDVVRTMLVGEPAQNSTQSPPRHGAKKQDSGGPVTVLSHQMTYTDSSRQVVFEGRVRARGRDGQMQSLAATAYLAAPSAAPETAQPAVAGFPAGRLERIVATGQVEVQQPGRRGSGERLVYTAADQTFVMTGTRAVPPRMVDDAQGTVTGASLRFRSGDNSVIVLGADGGVGDGRVRSDTKVKR